MKQVKMMWAGLLGAVCIFGVVLNLKLQTPIEANPDQMILMVFIIMAAAAFLVSVYLPRFMLKDAKKSRPELFQNNHAQASLSDDLVQQLLTPLVVRFALCESIAAFGMGAGMMYQSMEYFYPFASVSIAALIFNFPSESKLRAFAFS